MKKGKHNKNDKSVWHVHDTGIERQNEQAGIVNES